MTKSSMFTRLGVSGSQRSDKPMRFLDAKRQQVIGMAEILRQRWKGQYRLLTTHPRPAKGMRMSECLADGIPQYTGEGSMVQIHFLSRSERFFFPRVMLA